MRPRMRRQAVHGRKAVGSGPTRLARGPAAIEAEKTRLAAAAVAAGTEVETAAPAATGERIGKRAVKPFTFKIGPVKPVGERRINIMVYGPYGHGKTTFAASADQVESMQDVLFINAESGDMSLTGHRTLDIIDINEYDQLARIFEYLTLHCMWRDEGNDEKLLHYEKMLKSEVIPVKDQVEPKEEGRTWFEEQRLRSGKPMDEPYRYRTVILDSISEAHKYLVYKFTGVKVGENRLDEEIERMEEWQPAQELFRLLIRSFRDLPMNVIFVSAESIEPNERNKRKNPLAGQSLPKLAGQMAADIAGFIDIVGYLLREIGKDGERKRYLYLGAGYEGWISKHRFENLPDLEYVEEPTLASLIDLARKDAEAYGTSQSDNTASSRRNVSPGSDTASATATVRRSAAASSVTGRRAGRDRGGRTGRPVRRER